MCTVVAFRMTLLMNKFTDTGMDGQEESSSTCQGFCNHACVHFSNLCCVFAEWIRRLRKRLRTLKEVYSMPRILDVYVHINVAE